MRLHELQERAAALTAEYRGILAAPAEDGGDLSPEQDKRVQELQTEIANVEKRITQQRFIDEAERRMQGTPVAGSGDDRFDDALRGFSLRAAIAGAAGLNVEWGRERELSAELARRAGRPFQGIAVPMSVFHKPIERRVITSPFGSPPTGGGNLIGTDHRGDLFIDALRAAMVVRRLGARVISGLVGNVDIPALAASGTTAWVAENSAISTNEQEFAKVSLTPKHAGGIVELSRNMLQQPSPDVEALIRADFADLLAQAMDRAAIKGGGANEPRGVLSLGIDTSVSMGAGATWAKVLEIIEKVQTANAEGTAWVTTPSVVRLLRSTQKAAGTDSAMIQEDPNSLAGYPLAATTNCPGTAGSSPPNSVVIFGNWADVLVGFWSELDVLANPYESTAYAKGNVLVRAMMTCDIAVRHRESFAASVDVPA